VESPLEEKHYVSARIYFLQCVMKQMPQPRTDDLKLQGEKAGQKRGKRKPRYGSVYVSMFSMSMKNTSPKYNDC